MFAWKLKDSSGEVIYNSWWWGLCLGNWDYTEVSGTPHNNAAFLPGPGNSPFPSHGWITCKTHRLLGTFWTLKDNNYEVEGCFNKPNNLIASVLLFFPLVTAQKGEYISTAHKHQNIRTELQCFKSRLPFYNSGPQRSNKALLKPAYI